MQIEQLKVCKILTFTKDDYDFFSSQPSNFSLAEIIFFEQSITTKHIATIETYEVPIQIVGYENAKEFFKNQNDITIDLFSTKIKENIFWTNSISATNKDEIVKNTNDFIKYSIDRFLLSSGDYISYDAILNGSFKEFISVNISIGEGRLFLYFYTKALYIYDVVNKKTIGISLESLRYVGESVKQLLTDFIINEYSSRAIMFSFDNFCKYVYIDKIKNSNNNNSILTFENIYWAKYGEDFKEEKIECKIKSFYSFNFNLKKIFPFILSTLYNQEQLTLEEYNFCNRLYQKDVITEWLSNREIFYNTELFEQTYKVKNIKSLKRKSSNKKALTGRIYCVDDYNPQVLPKDGDKRKCIVSKFEGGKILVFDYDAFELKISMYLTQNKEYIEKFKNKDFHEEAAKIIYQKEIVSSDERHFGKIINHPIIYGVGKEKLNSLLKDFKDSEKIVKNIKFGLLKPILDKESEIKNIYKESGYLINSFGTIIKPQKEWAVFNNFIQTIAADIAVEKLYEIKRYFEQKSLKSGFIFQVFDSFVFDLHPDEHYIIEELKSLLSIYKNFEFNVDYQIGNNFYEATN